MNSSDINVVFPTRLLFEGKLYILPLQKTQYKYLRHPIIYTVAATIGLF